MSAETGSGPAATTRPHSLRRVAPGRGYRMPASPPELAFGPAENVYDLGDLLALVFLVAVGNRVFDAMRNVVAEDFLLGAAKCRPDRRDLRHHVDAIAVFLDHPAKAPDLALYATEPFPHGGFRFHLHA